MLSWKMRRSDKKTYVYIQEYTQQIVITSFNSFSDEYLPNYLNIKQGKFLLPSKILRVGNHNLNFPYMLSSAVIPTKNVCRDLGVFVGNDLYYRRHYEIVTRNSHFLCKQFRNAFVSKNI